MPIVAAGEDQKTFLRRAIPFLIKEGKEHDAAIGEALGIWDAHEKHSKQAVYCESDLAFSLVAAIEVGSNGNNAKTAPVKIVANSGDPVDYPKIGKLVFDFDSMTHKPKIHLDWAHEETIGYLNKIDKETGLLTASGAIVPGEGQFAERAKDIILKMQGGVPYEASIETHGGRLEEIAGKATVNGREIQGPITVLRDWNLAAVAICKFGKDSKTAAGLRLAAMKTNGDDMPLTTEQVGKIKLLMGRDAPSDLAVENAADHVIAYAEKVSDLATKLAAKVPAPKTAPDSGKMFLARKALETERNKCIRAGITTVAGAKAFEARKCGKDFAPDTLTLSRASGDSDAAIFDGMMDCIETYESLALAGPGIKMGANVEIAADPIVHKVDESIDGGEKDSLVLAMKAMNRK